MVEILTFKDLDKLSIEARAFFRKNLDETQKEFEELFSFCFKLIKSITKFYTPDEWKGSRQEYSLGVLMQSIETVLAMYYLTESGFWDNSLVLKRNYAELLSVAIAIGYDNQCYIDWKNNRDCFNSFGKIAKRIEQSNDIRELDKEFLPLLKKYWNEASKTFSHNVSFDSIRTLVKSGQSKFEPKTATPSFQQKRLRTFRNMVLNIISVLLGIFHYEVITESRKEEFPEALEIIRQANLYFSNKDWKAQETK